LEAIFLVKLQTKNIIRERRERRRETSKKSLALGRIMAGIAMRVVGEGLRRLRERDRAFLFFFVKSGVCERH
jgi:hypothetical protein